MSRLKHAFAGNQNGERLQGLGPPVYPIHARPTGRTIFAGSAVKSTRLEPVRNSHAAATRAMREAPQTRFRVAPVGAMLAWPRQTMGKPMNYDLEAARLKKDWAENSRWKGIKRGYTAEEVVRLRGSVHIEHTLARRGSEKLWKLVSEQPFVNSLGAMTGNQAMQQVKAGLKAIYLSGWQVAADANVAGEMYPDQSLYPINSVPLVVKRINNTFARADQIQHMEGSGDIDFFAPIVADAEAGFGGVLNAFELMKSIIEAGAAGVHFEDQLAAVKKCGHMGGKVLVPTREAVEKLNAARLAADVSGTSTLVIARTDAEAADLLPSDVDDNDKPFCTGERTVEG